MPITLEVAEASVVPADLNDVFNYFSRVDHQFSVFKPTSEVSLWNDGKLSTSKLSADLREVLALAQTTKEETDGYFDIYHNGRCNPSGLVKGWAIWRAAKLLWQKGFKNFYIDAGGDIQTSGVNQVGEAWRLGIRHPFELDKIVKVLAVSNGGVATSGTYLRGQHVYNPRDPVQPLTEIVSLTVVGPNVYEADRFATAAFAKQRAGLELIAKRPGLEGYMIDKNGQATMTSGLDKFII